jgi:hypothetical protein
VAFVGAWYQTYQEVKVSLSDLFKLANDRGLAIVAGKFESDKQANFEKRMVLLEDNSFTIKVGEKDHDHAISRISDANGTAYFLSPRKDGKSK